MRVRLNMKTIVIWCSVIAVGLVADAWFHGGIVVGTAEARVGRPLTPVSVGGVARRTTRRAVVRRSTVYVAALPVGCATVNIDGTILSQCGGTYYQPYQSQYVVVYVD